MRLSKFLMLLKENQNFPQTVSADEVLQMVKRLHHTPEDFNGGDLTNRIYKFKVYILKEIPLSSLNLDEFGVHKPDVDAYAERLRNKEQMPPIVYDAVARSIIDGTHRANAAATSNLISILAYVGIQKNMDPNWSEDERNED